MKYSNTIVEFERTNGIKSEDQDIGLMGLKAARRNHLKIESKIYYCDRKGFTRKLWKKPLPIGQLFFIWGYHINEYRLGKEKVINRLGDRLYMFWRNVSSLLKWFYE